MRKIFTQLYALVLLCFGINTLHGQVVTLWPTTDSATIRASEFSDTTQIFRSTSTTPNPPAGFKGWTSKPVFSDDPTQLNNVQWDWARAGLGNKGQFWGTRGAIGSASAANGAAIFNSDHLDWKGGSLSPHGADLISPIIDIAGKNDVTVVFNQYYRNFDVLQTGISWSEDGGATWKDTVDVIDNFIIEQNFEINNRVALKLKGSKGSANFRIKFIFDGDYYFWMVDDVRLVTMDVNMRVNKNWFASPQNYVMPRHQTDTVVFMADIENQGNRNATNVRLTVDIRDNNNVSVYNVSRNYGTIKPDSIAENEVFGRWLPPSTGTGSITYTGRYIVSSDNPDNFTQNDTIAFPFVLADSLYQNETGQATFSTRPGDGAWTGTTPHSWKVGNYYYFAKGNNITATRIRTFVDTVTLAGTPLTAILYSWTDTNNDGLVQETERKQIAGAEVVVTKPATGRIATVDFILENIQGTGAIRLSDKTAYLAMIEYNTTKQGTNMWMYWSPIISNGPMQFATSKVGRPRYNTIISYNGGTDPWNTNTFRGDDTEKYTPLVRMWSWPIRTDTKEPLSAANKIDIFPNPAQNDMTVSFELEKTEPAVLVRIIDMSGKILKERDYDNVKDQKINFDLKDIPNGIYNIQIQTTGNYRTMRFVKAN